MKFRNLIIGLTINSLLMISCGTSPPDKGKLKVVATTTIIGDVLGAIGGELIELNVLLPLDADPHSFEPTPKDLAQAESADIVFINGLGLEEALEELLQENSGNVHAVSSGVETIAFKDGDGQEHEGSDPHVWMNPRNVIVWVDNIVSALSELDPANAADWGSGSPFAGIVRIF